ncbi:MAG: cyclic nucleotide-binding domain-containing protein, partial [Elusimicrobiota bacterium]
MASQTEWLPLLRKVFLFSSFTGDQLQLLTKKIHLVSYPRGAMLFHENDPADTFYLILSGSVHLKEKNNPKESSSTNELKSIFLSRGDYIGGMALLSGERRSHTATVESTSDILVLTKKDFDDLLEHNPTLALNLSRVLSSRLSSYQRGTPMGLAPAKIFSFITGISEPDHIIFSVNLGLSLFEQTKKRTLLVLIHQGNPPLNNCLGIENPILDADN